MLFIKIIHFFTQWLIATYSLPPSAVFNAQKLTKMKNIISCACVCIKVSNVLFGWNEVKSLAL